MKRGVSSMLFEYVEREVSSYNREKCYLYETLLNCGKGKVTKKESQVFIRNNVASLHDFI